MPSMVRDGYDTICHEHLEYYSLRQIKWMTARCGLKILNVEMNKPTVEASRLRLPGNLRPILKIRPNLNSYCAMKKRKA